MFTSSLWKMEIKFITIMGCREANGEASVRKTSDYMKNYFINRYGAIEDIDFTDIVSDILRGEIDDERSGLRLYRRADFLHFF